MMKDSDSMVAGKEKNLYNGVYEIFENSMVVHQRAAAWKEVDMQGAMRKLKEKNKSFWIIVLSISFALLGVLCFFYIYFGKVYDVMLEKDMEQTEWTSHFVTKLIHGEIEHCVSNLYASEEFFSYYEEFDNEHLVDRLHEMKERLEFERVGIYNMEGKGVDDTGKESVTDDPQFLANIQNDKVYISNVIEESDRMLLAVPMHKDGQVVGSIWGYYAVSTIAEKIELTETMHRFFQIIDDNGEYISKSGNVYSFAQNLNIWKELERYEFEEGVTVEKIREKVEAGEKGYFYFSYRGEGRYVTYEPLGINNWYVFSVMVEDFLGESVKKVEKIFARLLMGLLICIVFVMGIIATFVYRTMKTIRGQNQKLQVKNSLLSMILKNTNDIPFEIDLKNHQLFLYHNNIEKEEADYEIIDDISGETLLEKGIIRGSFCEQYEELYQKLLRGEQLEPVTIEMKIGEDWNWYRIHTFWVDRENIVGFLEDYNEIASQDQKIKEITKENQTDALTGLYARTYFVQTVEERLRKRSLKKEKDYCALLLLDLDYFKQVNDRLGHIVGDQVMQETGRLLKKITRKTDLCGRLGGDEFVVFVQNVTNVDGISKCAEKINQALSLQYGDADHMVTVTASIGVAVVREELRFKELYERADKMLYQVKKETKNSYKVDE